MGRFPLMTAVEEYLGIRKKKVQENTWKNDARVLRHIARNIEEMREGGSIRTTHPKQIGPDEIMAFIAWMQNPSEHKGKPLDLDTQVRYLGKLEPVLERHGNKVIQKMRDDGYTMPRPAGPKPIRALSSEQLEEIQRAVAKVKPAKKQLPSWRMAQARIMAFIYPATGMRPSELREVKYKDLNLKEWKIHVSKPKGANKYARERDPIIMPPYRQEMLLFLEERKKYLASHDRTEAEYLVPNLEYGKDTCYSSNHFRRVKKELQELSGVSFRIKDFRPTFASESINNGAQPKDVAVQLGHANEITTLRYYALIDAAEAGQRLERIWEEMGTSKRAAAPSKGSDEPLLALLNALGVRSIEDLLARIPPKIEKPGNLEIDSEKRLTGYA